MEKKGIVLDIQRCSLHDGPGIRTTVFLKGCPLSCKWCHNPESKAAAPQLALFEERCVKCGECARVCKNHSLTDLGHLIEKQSCILCGKCIGACPGGVLKIFGEAMSAHDVMEIVLKDKSYYEHTGGGLTVSGGEPFYSFEFLRELLVRAKAQGINTCIETSGFTLAERIKEIAALTDVFLFDCKETRENKHIEFTGIGSKEIIKNFNLLYKGGSNIILRCPIIPGYNDDMVHLKNICDIEKNYPKLLGIEIMPYHNYGKVKAQAVGVNYEIETDTCTYEQKSALKETIRLLGGSTRLVDSF